MTKKTIISARHLKKSFGTGSSIQTVYSDLNIDIYKGDFTVIMGPSGSGKSTLMYSLSGMDKPDAGQIIFDNTDISHLTSDQLAKFRRKQCGFIFQQIYFMKRLSVMDNVITAAILTNRKQKEIVSRAKELFSLVNLPEQTQEKLPSAISGGEAQRAGVIRAIINDPNILFADEPTGALNSANSKAVLDIFSSLHKKGQSIVMVTHDKESALRGNRIVYIKDGQIFGECNLGNYSQSAERKAKFESFLIEMGW
ncbi:ABC transporter ATP-binding protein [Streptococcus macacae]|uniref:ABC transporter, ATP-binding protein n=1 Tax=Streptococcus macacae NCTC 11558 TaxID=764298 RepID=G5JX06_9STRE|nr:ABC transporter ATP-binding protein [Streptococcus macacae]EHJ52563.1 ABC transporter, ATP-binding protein [Streptococcus macacae NCTC 11558]SUN79483.1 ABC transporter ATP-binding protein [Streptococcus macacae NCTC 11558]